LLLNNNTSDWRSKEYSAVLYKFPMGLRSYRANCNV
jgi:hypothetical protein